MQTRIFYKKRSCGLGITIQITEESKRGYDNGKLFFYNGIMQARYIKLLQTVHPEKRGDVSSRKFHQQWVESCDEAEKEVIYQSSYKTYIFMSKAIGLLLIVTMLSHLFFKTGIMAILVVGVMYLILVGKYSCSCVSLRKDRILRS